TWCMIRTAVRYPTLPLAIGITATMTGALVHGSVDAFYFWPDLAMSFWLLAMSSRIGLSSLALAQSSPAQT
ncbi:hypothetical protein, partial [Chloroflexus sp.]